jgi:acyl carrier protein
MTNAETQLLTAIRTVRGPGSSLELDEELAAFIRDSFDFFELQLALEEAFGKEIDSERFMGAKTVRDLLVLLMD